MPVVNNIALGLRQFTRWQAFHASAIADVLVIVLRNIDRVVRHLRHREAVQIAIRILGHDAAQGHPFV